MLPHPLLRAKKLMSTTKKRNDVQLAVIVNQHPPVHQAGWMHGAWIGSTFSLY
jgi:hypothetical protein